MTDAERSHLTTLIGRYLAATDPDERCDARNDLRRALGSAAVIYDGFLYTSRHGELVVIDMSRVVILGGYT